MRPIDAAARKRQVEGRRLRETGRTQSREKPSNPLVIYHGGCHDGFCSAWLANLVFEDAEFFAAKHGDSPPDVAGRNVIVVDFSYPRLVMEEMYDQTESLIVLDHHKSAEENLRGLPYCVFDMEKSGARLMWDWLVQNGWSIPHVGVEKIPWIVAYVEDRDLWRFNLEHSREINAWLRSFPMEFETWSDMATHGIFDGDSIVESGAAILRSEKQTVASHVRNAKPVKVAGHEILAVNATTLFSDIAGELATDRPFGMAYFFTGEKFVFSLRSKPDGEDVSEIAKQFGGGGHKHAAGFQLSPEDGMKLIAQ
ncbi:Oligoribonuclease NrnB [Thalassoglobus neptunius]|uniref:Oligoribonuclease NrnB n=1 Tax=Thalassoglobus neptunius TaxID=1938619 RepID=A0A5C5X7X8_9PLAN|nr:DHHA1 domain-containing protein [Thalassoglobus neptunius]TWT58918.1 Oligoribonuclease NrnB [Thalassoglobus neptunius]